MDQHMERFFKEEYTGTDHVDGMYWTRKQMFLSSSIFWVVFAASLRHIIEVLIYIHLQSNHRLHSIATALQMPTSW